MRFCSINAFSEGYPILHIPFNLNDYTKIPIGLALIIIQ